MADQPNQAMTLREAVAHERRCPNEMDFHPTDCCDRARAIVDAAVEFIEAQAKVNDSHSYDYGDEPLHSDTWERLRDLERGEDAP